MFKAHKAMPKNNSTHSHTHIYKIFCNLAKAGSLYFIKVGVELGTVVAKIKGNFHA